MPDRQNGGVCLDGQAKWRDPTASRIAKHEHVACRIEGLYGDALPGQDHALRVARCMKTHGPDGRCLGEADLNIIPVAAALLRHLRSGSILVL